MNQPSIDDIVALTGGSDFWHTTAIPAVGLPAVMLTDGPHGVRKQVGSSDHLGLNESAPATCFPPAVALSATWNAQLLRTVGAALGTEARALGVGVLLGPGANLKRSPLCGRNFEYFSEDPHLSGELAAAYVTGVQSQGVGTSVKHFAANNQETDRMRRDSQIDERTLREMYLRAFATIVTKAQPWTVMCAYNRVNGVPAAENEFLLTQVLRGEWGFDGFVMSDWGAVRDRVASLKAGLDLEMPANPLHEADVHSALAAGEIDEDTVTTAYSRIARVLAQAAEGYDPAATFDMDSHHALARTAAEQAIVLLSNDGILPLANDVNVAVIGEFARTPRYQGAGSSRVNPTKLENALDAIRELTGTEVPFAPGFTTAPDQELAPTAIADAVAVASASDVVLMFLGLGEDHESEGYDRTTLELPSEQLDLLDQVLAVNPNVIVILSNGSSVLVPFAPRVRAVVAGSLLGQAGGGATASVLFGDTNPSGKITETIPLREQDVPSHLHFPGDVSGVRYGEGLFVGYRGYDAAETPVAFPFGHGLSYTTFSYEDLVVTADANTVTVRVTITNDGSRAGREIVQVYVGVPHSAVVRVPRELKGFASVELAPGESRTISIAIAPQDLSYWSVRDHAWLVEAGEYQVSVGASSRDLRATKAITLPGNEPRRPLTLESTVAEALAVPQFAPACRELLVSAFGDAAASGLGDLFPDMTLGAVAGFARESTRDLRQRLDQLT